MCRWSEAVLNCVRTKIRLIPELMQLLIGISTSRYFPARGTPGLHRVAVNGWRRVPRPPPMITPRTLGFTTFIPQRSAAADRWGCAANGRPESNASAQRWKRPRASNPPGMHGRLWDRVTYIVASLLASNLGFTYWKSTYSTGSILTHSKSDLQTHMCGILGYNPGITRWTSPVNGQSRQSETSFPYTGCCRIRIHLAI